MGAILDTTHKVVIGIVLDKSVRTSSPRAPVLVLHFLTVSSWSIVQRPNGKQTQERAENAEYYIQSQWGGKLRLW